MPVHNEGGCSDCPQGKSYPTLSYKTVVEEKSSTQVHHASHQVSHTQPTKSARIQLPKVQSQSQQEKPTSRVLSYSFQDYQEKKEMELLSTMENWQIGMFYAYNQHPNYLLLMKDVLDSDQYKKFHDWKNPKVLPIPDFLNDQIDPTQEPAFKMLLDTRNLEAVDSWMLVFPQLKSEYKKWRKEHLEYFATSSYEKLTGSVVDKIQKIVKHSGLPQRPANPEATQQESASFRERQGSYTKMMAKEHIGNELNIQTDILSRMNKLREEGKNRSSHSDSATYCSPHFTGQNTELADDKKELLEKEVTDLVDKQRSSNTPTEQITESNEMHDDSFDDLVKETPITVEYLKELKETTLERLPEEMNILLLGESGVGKSTFLNSFGNYVMYNSPDEALTKGIQLLTNVNYIFYDNERNPTDISEGSEESENVKIDEKTTDPKIHTFETVSPNGFKKIIRLLDTPGVGDEQGMDTDKLNFPKIMKTLSEFDHINAICILMPSNEARMNTMFRYSLNELLTQLDKSVRDNIFFCFTRSRTTMYRFGDTVPNLVKHFAEIKVDIPVDQSTAFCFDNECVRYLLAKKKGMNFEENEEMEYLTSWNKSAEATFQLLEKVAEINPVSINNTLNLNQTKRFLERISMPLVEILKLHVMNKQLLDSKLKANSEQYHLLANSSVLNKPKYTLVVKVLDKPQMVCTSARCSKTNTIASDYRVCHRGCIVQETSNKIPHPELEFCCKIRHGKCSICGCSWKTHMHVTESYETREDVSTQRYSFNQTEEKKLFEDEKREIELEIDTILSSCAQFSAYISQSALAGESDTFKQAFDEIMGKVMAVRDTVAQYKKASGKFFDQYNLDNTKENLLYQELVKQKLAYLQNIAQIHKKKIDEELVEQSIENLKSLKCWSTVVEAVETNFRKYNEEIGSKVTEGDYL